MSTTLIQPQHDPRKIADMLFVRANSFWLLALACKSVSVLLGALLVLLFPNAKFSYLPITVVYILGEIFSWRSDNFKSAAQTILRKLDFRDSFGWEISGEEMSDIIMSLPSKIRKSIPQLSPDNYFASSADPGPTRALENLQESAWWSKQLASRMGDICLGITIGLVALSLIVMAGSVYAIQNTDTLSSIVRITTSLLMLIFSLGIWRLIIGYYTFKGKAEGSEQHTKSLFNSGCDHFDAVKAWHDYQVARASAPLIPSWLWRRMRDDLNKTWEIYRKRNPSQCIDAGTMKIDG